MQLWITFFGTTIIFILTTTAFLKFQERYDVRGDNNRHHKSIGETAYRQFEYVLKIITSQGIWIFNSKQTLIHMLNVLEGYLVRYQSQRSFKLLVDFWLISMVALINAYTSVMTALLTVPKLEPIANTLEEAVNQNRFVTIVTNTPISRIISVHLLDSSKKLE